MIHKTIKTLFAAVATAMAMTASAETAIPASAYVQDGLIAQWDGIENAGAGTHDNAATAWTDLSGNGNDLTGITSYGAFVEDGFRKSTKGSKKYSLGLAPLTYEVVCDFSNYSGGWIVPISTTSTYYPTFRMTGSAGDWTFEMFYGASNKDLPVFGGFSVKLQEKGRLTITCCHYVNPDNASDNFVRFYINGVEVDNNYSTYWSKNEDSVFGAGSVGHTSQNTVGHKFCAIRLYGRALPPVEIAHNAQLDAVRFSNDDGYRYNEDTQKIEYRILAEADGDGAVKVGDGEWMTAVTNWVEIGVPETYWFSALPSEGSTFAFWRIRTGETSELENADVFSRTISGPTVLQATFRDERSMKRWAYLTSAESGGAGSAVISNVFSHTVLKVSASGVNLTVTGIFKNGEDVLEGAKTLDLSTPVESLSGETQYSITAINAKALSPVFENGAENLYLPDTLTKIVAQFLDSHQKSSSLHRVQLPAGMTDLSAANYAFRGCTNLVEVLPAGVLESGRITAYATSIFYNCTALTNCPNLVNAVKAPETFMYSCKSAVGNPHIENLETISSGAFNGCASLTFDNPQTMTKLKEVASSSAFNGTTIANLDLSQSPVTKLYMNGAAGLKSVSPMLSASVQGFSFNGCSALTGDVVVASADCASIPENAFNGTKITSCDMANSSVEQFGKNAFYSCSALTNVVIPRAFNLFKTETPFSGGALTHVRFMGDVPAIDVTSAQFGSSCTKMAFYVPYWNESWERVLSASGEEMAAADVTTFRANHPGEPVPVQKLNLDGRSGAKPVARWVVDPPTETTRGPLSFFETLRADGVQASVSHPLAFDGTTYALGAADLMCTCWAGDEIVIAMPEAATLTRGLKLTAYRIHQMSAGEHPNGRAPTAWTLYGKRTDDGNWVEIDSETMTAESANKWPFFEEDSNEIPPQSQSALTYEVGGVAAACYVAFKFVPTSSFLHEIGVGVDSPIGFGEIELLGAMASAEPVIGSFAVASSDWKAVTFEAELFSHGEGAAWTRGTVELSTTSDFAEIVARSAATDLEEGGIVPITVSGLEAGVAYYARLKVENDAGGSDERSLEGTVSSLAVPFELAGGMFPAPTKGAYGFTVSVEFTQLFASSAIIELYYAPDGVTYGATPLQTKVIDEPGTVTFDPFPSDEPFAFVKIRIVTEDGGVTFESEYVRSVHEIWLGNSESVTAISNTVKGIVLKCSLSGTNVTVSGITDYNNQTVFDLTLPVCDKVCKPLAITSVGSTFSSNQSMTELYLPDTVTTLVSQAIDQWGLGMGELSRLVKLRLPNAVASMTSYNCRGMRQLQDCENLLPRDLTTLGENVFSYWVSITNDIHFYEAFRTFSGKTPFANGFANVKRVYFHGKPADPTTGVFAPMTTLEFFVPPYDEAWQEYLAQSCETRALTAEDRAAFRTAYPGERMPKMMVKMPAGASKWRYLRYWYPDPKKRPGFLMLVK